MAIRGSKLFRFKNTPAKKARYSKNPRTRLSKVDLRRKKIASMSRKHGAAAAMRKLKLLARKNPAIAEDLLQDATWLINQNRPKESQVDPRQLAVGIEVELEHTPNHEVAKKIALDHLAEDPQYYTKLKQAMLRNPDFEWGPKLFNPLKDSHPFEKNPLPSGQQDVGGLFSSIYKKHRNPDETGGLFTSLFKKKRKRNI